MNKTYNCIECGVPHHFAEVCPAVSDIRRKLANAKLLDKAVAVSTDAVNHPPHYKAHPSGVECIQITEHMNFCRGNAVKYIWRAGLKSEDAVQDLEKAAWYIQREIERIKKEKTK